MLGSMTGSTRAYNYEVCLLVFDETRSFFQDRYRFPSDIVEHASIVFRINPSAQLVRIETKYDLMAWD